MAEVTGKKSRTVDADVGLSILEGFLEGFKIPSAGIKAKFSAARKVTYSFHDVVRKYVEPNDIGDALTGKLVNERNPASAIFFDSIPYRFLVIDSVITSAAFTISVDKSSAANFNFDIPAIQVLIGNAKTGMSVSSATGYDLTFSGRDPLTFAFTCVEFVLDGSGRIAKLLPAGDVGPLAFDVLSATDPQLDAWSEPVLLSDIPGLLDIEVFESPATEFRE